MDNDNKIYKILILMLCALIIVLLIFPIKSNKINSGRIDPEVLFEVRYNLGSTKIYSEKTTGILYIGNIEEKSMYAYSIAPIPFPDGTFQTDSNNSIDGYLGVLGYNQVSDWFICPGDYSPGPILLLFFNFLVINQRRF